jgi:alkylhydroperoxidase family enzyme
LSSQSDFFQRPIDSPRVEWRRIPALRALEEHPIGAVVVADDGAVLFANTAFTEVLGCSCDAVTSMTYDAISAALPAGETLFAVTRLSRAALRSSPQAGRATCFIKICKSARFDGADSRAVAMLKELLE